MRIFITLLKINLRFIYFFLKLLPITNKVVFISRQSNEISLDFKLLADKLDCKTMIICKKIDKNYISYYFNLYKQMYHLATSRVCVIDSYCIPVSILKHKKNLTIIQMWHALGAVKKFGYQTIGKKDGRDFKISKMMNMHKNYDYILGSSIETIKYFSEAFNYDRDKFVINGLPKIDYLVENNNKLNQQIKNDYPVLNKKQNILYVPTFRKSDNINIEELINEIDFNKYNLIVKFHPKTNQIIDDQRVLSCSKYTSFELLTIADYVITDYSAICLEAISINKKVLFYLYDYNEYINNNGLNIDLFKEFKYTFTNAKDLIKSLDNYDYKYVETLKLKYLDQDYGNYTFKLVKLIESKMTKQSILFKNVFLRKILRKIKYFVSYFNYQFYYYRYKVDDKLVLFESYMGRNYTCSPRAIYEYMKSDSKYNDYKFVWVFNDIDKYEIDDIKVKKNSKQYYKYLSKSKYWIVNSLIDPGIKKKKNQIYIQTWHGTPLKKLRCDIEVEGLTLNSIDEIKSRNDKDAVKFDYFISPSRYATKKFISAFNLKELNKENIIIEKGYPRNDYLFKYNTNDIDKIKENLNIPKGKKVILYAPTFRDNQNKVGIGYTYQLELNLDMLLADLKDYVVLFRSHYFITNSLNLEKYKNFIYDVSNYNEINELYIISDMLITDYSSVFFDYANLNKPIIFYMYDLDLYKNKLRDFYLDLDMLPGKIVQNQKDLVREIKNVKKIKNENFKKKFNYLDDKNSSKRVVEAIFK